MKDKEKCNIHIMPPTITDEDIVALFNGIMSVMRRKIELDARAEIINTNLTNERLLNQLKEKTAECVRLKNEIIYLKSQIKSENLNI